MNTTFEGKILLVSRTTFWMLGDITGRLLHCPLNAGVRCQSGQSVDMCLPFGKRLRGILASSSFASCVSDKRVKCNLGRFIDCCTLFYYPGKKKQNKKQFGCILCNYYLISIFIHFTIILLPSVWIEVVQLAQITGHSSTACLRLNNFDTVSIFFGRSNILAKGSYCVNTHRKKETSK